VLEIGPGLGDLTRALEQVARSVMALELDHGLVRALQDVSFEGKVEIRQGDALDTDLLALGRELAPPVLLVGNLPYRVAGRLIGSLLHQPELFGVFRRLGFMVQREVAERLVASPGGREYSVLSVWAGLFSTPRCVLEFPPEAFVPRPKVHSTFVLLDPARVAPPAVDHAVLADVVRLAFRFRRKTLRRALSELVPERALLDEALADAGLEGERRGETLSGADFTRLAGAIGARRIRG